MSFFKFLTSRVFLKQLIIALIAIVVLAFMVLQWLKGTTNHGEFVEVPNLAGKSLKTVQMELKDADLTMEIQDSANYNPDYPKYSVIEQYPSAGAQVKENRKIYLTLNPSGYRKVALPKIEDITFRQAKPTIETIGFEVGKISYKPNIAKDRVLEVWHDGKRINEGDFLPLKSKIDLVLGRGN